MAEDAHSASGKNTPPRGRARARLAVALLSLLVLCAFLVHRGLEAEFSRPADPNATEATRVHVRPGMSFAEVRALLARKRLIRNPRLFDLQARLRGGARRMQAGVYALKASMSPREIYRRLSEGRVVQRTFTVPEGSSLREIARTIERAELAGEQEILALARDASFLRELGVPADSLEGYAFPDTYHFPEGVSARKILAFMVRTMHRKFSPALREQAREMGFTLHQALTLASIVEKETAIDAERPLVAAVFVNRLRRGMRLQSDPTVIYGLPRFDGNLTRKHLRHDSPYNTYRRRGLPPGPIASPGLASIAAAVRPARVKYLYFVAKKEGGHQFSRTYREHRRAVNRYRRR